MTYSIYVLDFFYKLRPGLGPLSGYPTSKHSPEAVLETHRVSCHVRSLSYPFLVKRKSSLMSVKCLGQNIFGVDRQILS